jgi:hypothetical protein
LKNKKIYLLAFPLVILLLSFQNCSKKDEYHDQGSTFKNLEKISIVYPRPYKTFRIEKINFLKGYNVEAFEYSRSNQVLREVSSLEMPPIMLGAVNGAYRSIVSSFESYLCSSSSKNIFLLQKPTNICRLFSTPVVDSSRRTYEFNENQIINEAPWKRNYSGLFSAHLINNKEQGSALVGIAHYENKGETQPYVGRGLSPFLNTIGPRILNTVGTLNDGHCLEANGCYFASVGLQWRPAKDVFTKVESTAVNDLWDYGPITWPSAGYTSEDGLTKISDGPRHPYSIIKDGFIYVFYIDYIYTNGQDQNYSKYNSPERQPGLKLIRAPVENFSPPNWRAYFNGQFSEKTLPEEFDPQKMPKFSSQLGPKATVIFGEASTSRISFSVAKIKGTQSYIGAETYIDYNQSQCTAPGMYKVALRISEDLVNWSNRTDVYGCLPRKDFGLFYAKFLDSTGTTNFEVDPNEFYLIGTSSVLVDKDAFQSKNYSTQLNTLKLKIN